MEFYDQLVLIWGGSPATEPLAFGTSTEEVNTTINSVGSEALSESGEDCDITSLSEESPYKSSRSSTGKRKSMENPVPRLIDDKRRHMQCQLSAAQRDQLLINESKEETQFKRDIAEAIRQSNETFGQSMQQMSMSILQVAQGLTRSVEMMSQAMFMQNRPYQYSNQAPSNVFCQPSAPNQAHPTQYSNLTSSGYANPFQRANAVDYNCEKDFSNLDTTSVTTNNSHLEPL